MKRSLPILLVCLASAAPGAAQRIDTPYRFLDHGQHVGVFAGYVATSPGRLEMGPQSAATFGARWALRVSGPFSLGVDVAYTPTERAVRDTVFGADSLYREIGRADMRLLTALGNIRFAFTGPRTWHGIQPYALLGAGVALDLAGTAPADTLLATNMRYDFGTSFAGQLGAGVDWFPTSRVSLALDARNALWKIGVPDGFLLTERGRTLPRSEWESNLVFTAGVSIHF